MIKYYYLKYCVYGLATILSIIFIIKDTQYLWRAPERVPLAPRARVAAHHDDVISAIFGVPLVGTLPANTTLNLVLKGIFNDIASDGSSHTSALITSSGQDKFYNIKQHLSPGVYIAAITTRYVIINNQHHLELLALPER